MPAFGTNHVWAYDFVFDTCANGQSRFRDERLSIECFRSRREAKVFIEVWHRHYNAVRPHSSLHYRTPVEFKQHHEVINQGAVSK